MRRVFGCRQIGDGSSTFAVGMLRDEQKTRLSCRLHRPCTLAPDLGDASTGRARLSLNIFEHADGERRGPVSIRRAPKDASHPRPLRRYRPTRSSPSACAEKVAKNRSGAPAELVPVEFDHEFMYASTTVQFLIVSMFGAVMPLIVPLALFSCFVLYATEKYLLLTVYHHDHDDQNVEQPALQQAGIFFQDLGACRRRTPRAPSDPKVA